MTQQQRTPPRQLPACPSGHPARYILDGRRLEARGGHFIECRCSCTQKCATFDLAWAHWHKQHGLQPPAEVTDRPLPNNVVQIPLFAGARG